MSKNNNTRNTGKLFAKNTNPRNTGKLFASLGPNVTRLLRLVTEPPSKRWGQSCTAVSVFAVVAI